MFNFNLKIYLDSLVDWDSSDPDFDYYEILEDIGGDLIDETLYDFRKKLFSDELKSETQAKLSGYMFDNQGSESRDLDDMYISASFISDKYLDEEELVDRLVDLLSNITGQGEVNIPISDSSFSGWYSDPDLSVSEINFTLDVSVAAIEVEDVEEIDEID